MEHKTMAEKKVAIIGKASNSQMLAPYEDKSWEIWGLSNAYMEIPRWDVWFELHDWEYHRRVNPQHYEWLTKNHGKPLYAFEANYCGSKSLKFPLDEVMGMFGNHFNGLPQFRYWTNSPSYMMALAMLQGATTIGLWGIDMAMQDEYAYQRPSCELMIGACLAKGINIVIPPEASLCKCRRLYGYDTHADDGYVEVRTREGVLKQRLAQANQESGKAAFLKNMFTGALNEIQVMQSNQGTYNVEERIKMLQENLQQQDTTFQELERQKFIFQGALEDLSWVKTVFLT
jgi:hypothetical protein